MDFADAVAEQEIAPNVFMLDTDTEDAQEIAKSLLWYSKRFSPQHSNPDVPRFYDIASLTEKPKLFKRIIEIIVLHYRAMGAHGPTHIVGFDARGFLLGSPVAMMLGVPFVMLREADKSAGVLVNSAAGQEPTKRLVLRHNAIKRGDRVALVDDLIATGGTAINGFELIEDMGADITELIALIAVPALHGVRSIRNYQNGRFRNVRIFTLIHDDWIKDSNCADPEDFPQDGCRVIDVRNPTG